MKLLNLGCGGHRPQEEQWWNLDTLRETLNPGTPERTNLDAEPRYVECNILKDEPPFEPESFDGILCQHVLEHFCCYDAVSVLFICRMLLKPGGVLLASVPDADYFLSVYDQDTKDNAVTLFGEPIHDVGFEKFFDYALFRHDHEQVLNASSLMCLMLGAGFVKDRILNLNPAAQYYSGKLAPYGLEPFTAMAKHLNRLRFSAVVSACK